MSQLGVPLVERVLDRLCELDAALDVLDRDTPFARAIEAAAAVARTLVTGDIANPSDVVACALARWLARTRNLGRSIDRVGHAA